MTRSSRAQFILNQDATANSEPEARPNTARRHVDGPTNHDVILGAAQPTDLSEETHTHIKTTAPAEDHVTSLLGEQPAAEGDEAPTKKVKITVPPPCGADHLNGAGAGADEETAAAHGKKHIPTPHKNGGEQSLEPHMSKVREVAENRIFHDETNAAAAGSDAHDGTAFEKVGRERNAVSKVFEPPSAKKALGKRCSIEGAAPQNGENMANALTWA